MAGGGMILLAPKDPNEVIFYDFDWATRRLDDGEVIVDSAWEITGSATARIADDPAPSVTNGVCRAYVEGGAIGEVCILTNWVETNLNPRRDFSGKIKIKAK
jgi:hypothetical protein